ncbi:hypothetical protein F5B20DRAFT_589227 [Whalleya microplaca]|nr:hypothetical protein F5B20DRAFT_589227 [Whalleya microplaca]
MERTQTSSTASGILVERAITVHANDSNNGEPDTVHPESVISVAYSIPDLREDARTPEPRGEDISSSQPGKKLPRTDVVNDRQRDLADLFRRSPPPGNFMSVPDDSSSFLDDKKWKRFEIFRKRRKRRKQTPPIIKLPDSAISARTIGGYRHIAISIPLEYSQFGEMSSSQYPASKSVAEEFQRAVGSRLGLIRTRTADRSVTVLKPVAEDRETLSSVSASRKASAPLERMTSLAPPPQRAPQVERESSHREGKDSEKRETSGRYVSHIVPKNQPGPVSGLHPEQEYLLLGSGASEEHSDSPKSTTESRDPGAEMSQKIEASQVERVEGSSKQKQPEGTRNKDADTSISTAKGRIVPSIVLSYPPKTLILPERTSSKKRKATRTDPVKSLEKIGDSSRLSMSMDASSVSADIGTSKISDSEDDDEIGTRPRGSITESIVEESLMSESSPQLLKAQTATAYHKIPIVVRPPSRQQEVESLSNPKIPTPPAPKTDRSAQTELPSGPSPAAEKSRKRKERDRESKQRRVNKLVAQLRETQSTASHLLGKGVSVQTVSPDAPVVGSLSQELSAPSGSRQTSTTKKGLEIVPIQGTSRFELQMSRLSPAGIYEKQKGSPSSPSLNTSSSVSSLESHSDSWNRTHSLRRKKKQAEREEKEASEQFSAEAQAQQRETSARALRQEELLKRYERLKDIRIHDLERRLRHLERNGEVMMRSMVPLMESLNRLLQDQSSLRRDNPDVSQPQLYLRPQGFSGRSSHSLRSSRSHDLPLGTDRPQSSQRERRSHKHRPPLLCTHEEQGECGVPKVQLSTSTSPLQEEFDNELERRRDDEEIDTRLRQAALAQQEESRAPSGEDTHQDTGAQAQGQREQEYTTATEGETGSSGSSSLSDPPDSLGTLEPLMRELQDAARLSGEHGDETDQGGEGEQEEDEEERGVLLEADEVFYLF